MIFWGVLREECFRDDREVQRDIGGFPIKSNVGKLHHSHELEI